jgi:Dolichyl-phosphate-mannose-protein mannosyltransferase
MHKPQIIKPARIIELLDSVESWLIQNAVGLALAIIAVGLGFRIYYNFACYLNPDEALHVGLAQAGGLKQAYLKSLTQTHPPLLTLGLFFLLKFGSSEFLVRLPSLVAATLGAWLGFKWARRVFGTGPAIGMLVLLTFSPAIAFTAIEVRQYGLLLMGVFGAVYGLERAYDELSWKWMVFGFVFLYEAIFSHYGAIWITAALGCYGFLRLYQQGAKRRDWIIWIVGQSGAALLYIFLLVTHMLKMRSGWMKDYAVNEYLSSGYFHGSIQSLPEFLVSKLLDVFSYLSGNHLAGIIGLALFIIGVLSLLLIPAKRGEKKRADLAVLLMLPVIFGFAGAMMKITPFLGSRHITYLLPFLVAGLSFALFRWIKYPAITAVLISLAGPIWLMSTMASPIMAVNNLPEMLPREQMVRAMEFLSDEVPADESLLVDMQTGLEIKYYLGSNGPKRLKVKTWAIDGNNLMPFVLDIGEKKGIKPGQKLWIMSTGWYRCPPLAEAVPEQLVIRSRQFGQIGFVQFFMPGELPKGEQGSLVK